MGTNEDQTTVMKAVPTPSEGTCELHYSPPPIDQVVASILETKPPVVFMPHVETSTGIIHSDEYIKKIAEAVNSVDGLLVLDCIASGAIWIDMKALGVDLLISAPQKGWSGPACCGIVMMNQKTKELMNAGPASSSFALDLNKWSGIMDAYEKGGFGYHTTMPTDALRAFNNVVNE